MVAEGEGDDKEGDSKEHSDASDDVDEMVDFLGNGGLSGVQTWGEPSNTAHHGVVSAADHHSLGGACESRHGQGDIGSGMLIVVGAILVQVFLIVFKGFETIWKLVILSLKRFWLKQCVESTIYLF